MEAGTHPILGNDVVVGNPDPNMFINHRRVYGEIHVGLNLHGLIIADERSFDEIISCTPQHHPWMTRSINICNLFLPAMTKKKMSRETRRTMMWNGLMMMKRVRVKYVPLEARKK